MEVVLGYSKIRLLGELEDAALCLSIMFWLYTVLQYQSIVKFPCFPYFWGISSRPAAFLFLIFLSTMSNSSCINSPSLMSSDLLMIFVIGSSLTLENFPSRFLKCCFHKCIHSYWLAAFSLALTMLFLLLTSFTVCHAILDCLSSIKSIILLIWSWMYFVCSFKVCVIQFALCFKFLSISWVSPIVLGCGFHIVTFFSPREQRFALSLVGMEKKSGRV